MTQEQIDQAKQLFSELFDYEDDIAALRGAEATLFFILESQDKYTADAIAFVMERLRIVAKRMDEMQSKAIDLGKLVTGGEL